MGRNKFVWTLAVVIVASVAAFTTSTVSALCPASCEYPFAGRDFNRGYYTNADLPIDNSDPNTHGAFWLSGEAPWDVHNRSDFVNFVQGSLYRTEDGDVNLHSVPASYVVTAMLGYKGPDFGGSQLNGINTARSRFGDFSALIKAYDDAGLVIWDDTVNECPGDVQANLDYIAKDPFYYQNWTADCSPDPAITFLSPTVPGKKLFQLKKSCGNPIGDNQGLPPVVPPTVPPTGTINPPTPADTTKTPNWPPGYTPATTAQLNAYSDCRYTTGTAHDPNDNSYPVPVTVTYTGSFGTRTSNANSSTTSPYHFQADTPTEVQQSTASVTASASMRGKDGKNYPIAGSISFGPCLMVTPHCGLHDISPASLDPGTPFTLTTSVYYDTALEAQTARSQAGFRYFVRITGPGGYVYDQPNVASTGPGGTVTITGVVSPGPTNVTGKFEIGWGVATSTPIGSVNCGTAIPGETNPPAFGVANKPYFKVNGGDLSAGAGMSIGGTNCALTRNDEASIVSWNNGSSGGGVPSGPYGGAGTQYGALAMKHLLGFVSGQGSGYVPSTLSFGNSGGSANQVDEAQELYGGEFGTSACTADYWANATAPLPGGQTIHATSIPNGAAPQVLYVNGDVYIDGDITFAGATSGYGSVADIPSYTIVARGNIYIAPSVKTLDGFYIAQPIITGGVPSKGMIYTCAPDGFNTNTGAFPVLTGALNDRCDDETLTVNGAFVANQVWLLRTKGTLSSTTPAEVFNYTPDAWLSTPFGNGLTPPNTDEYDSITSLPPVL